MSNDNVNQKVQFCILLCRRSLEEAQEFRNEELKKGKILLLLAALQLCFMSKQFLLYTIVRPPLGQILGILWKGRRFR